MKRKEKKELAAEEEGVMEGVEKQSAYMWEHREER